ncbi:MAG: hypothetical protein QM817_31735 [Archangium sp.]
MSWLVALVGLSLTAAPDGEQTVVLLGRRTAAPAATAKTLTSDASKLLASEGVSLAMTNEAAMQQLARISVKDSANCNGKKACLAELGRQLKVPWVVLLSVAIIDSELSVGLELLRVSDETVVETDSLLLPKKAKLDASLLQGFAARVKNRLSPPPPTPEVKKDEPKKDDAPVATDLTPKNTEEPLLPPPPPPPARSHVPSLVLGGAGVASLLAGAALLTVGAVSRGPLSQGAPNDDGRLRSTLTYQQAQQLNDSSTPLVLGGIGALAVGAGLGTAAVIAW